MQFVNYHYIYKIQSDLFVAILAHMLYFVTGTEIEIMVLNFDDASVFQKGIE